MIVPMTIAKFKKILPKICGKDTSFDPKGWTKENPFWGHCGVIRLLADSLFQGGVINATFKGTKYSRLEFHFWNVFLDGKEKNFPNDKFGKECPGELQIGWMADGSVFFADKSMQRRLKLLQERFEAECKKK